MSVKLEHVHKSYGDQVVLNDCSLLLPEQGRVCFFGPSGCGKTTLLRLISGLEKPDSGTILRTEGIRFSCHFQEDRLLNWYTVAENLALTMPAEIVPVWLEKIGMPEAGKLYPDELSGGMRRRVSLARALGHDSDVLILDEPVRELDESMATAMLKLIQESIGQRLLLLVTHDRTQADLLGCTIVSLPR